MHRMNRFLGIFFFVLFVGYSCSQSSKNGKLLDFDEAIEQAKEMNMSEFFSSVEYVPLETTDSSLLSMFTKIGYISRDYILCITEAFGNSSSFPSYLFDRQGKFLKRIGVFGKGPHELNSGVKSGYVNKDKDRVVLFYNGASQGVSLYDLSGQWVGENKMNNEEFMAYVYGENHSRSEYYPQTELTGTDEHVIFIPRNFDSTWVFTGSIDRLGDLCRVPGVFGTYVGGKGRFFLPCFTRYSDYIGMYDHEGNRYCRFYYDGRVDSPYSVYCSKQIESLNGESNYRQWMFSWLETDRFCFINFIVGGSYKLIYDKRKDELYSLPKDVPGLKNDLTECEGLYWWPSGVTEDGVLYTKNSASWFYEQSEKSSDSKIKTLVESLKEDDNDVLIFVYPKK